jgi:alpha-L-fucosidase 2
METRRVRGGWPTAWDISVWARLERGDKVAACMQAIVRNSLSPNLHNTGSNQSDCNFGYTAGVAEALLQSHAGEISLLPALPVGWPDGSVRGLRARGGFEVSLWWQGGKLRSAEIRNANATNGRVRYGSKTAEFSVKAGEKIRLNAELESGNE